MSVSSFHFCGLRSPRVNAVVIGSPWVFTRRQFLLRGHCASGQKHHYQFFFCARRVMTRRDHRRIANLKRIGCGIGVGQGFKQKIPDPRLGPSMELAVDRAPLAELLRQGAPSRFCPREPKNPVQNAPMVAGRATTQRTRLNYKRLQNRPLRLIQMTFNHPSLLEAKIPVSRRARRSPLRRPAISRRNFSRQGR
jgi:hypothetical protein